MIPRISAPPRPGYRYVHRPGAYAILLRADRILLTRQVTADLDELQLPGGGIDAGELPLQALARELREETGHGAILTRRIGAYRDYTYMSEYGFHAAKLCVVYAGRPGVRIGDPSEPGHSAVWLRVDEAVDRLASRGSRILLARFLARGGLSARPCP